MRLKLPVIGEVRIGKDAETIETVKEVKVKEKFFDILGGMLDLQGKTLSTYKTVSEKVLKANIGWVYRNNDAIAQEVSKIEFELYAIGLSKGEVVYNQIDNHPLLDLLDKPNDESTSVEAMYMIQSHKKLAGDAFWLKVRGANNSIVALRILPADKVSLDLQKPTDKDPTVIKSYTYKDNIDGNQITVTYDPKDIIHFKKPNPNNPFRGLGAVEAMADTIDLDNMTSEVMKNFLKNGAIHNFALTSDAKITDEQLTRLKAELRATTNGPNNAFNVPIFGGGLKPADISYSNKEQQLLDQLEWYRDKIMYGFGNTKASLGMIDDVNRASHEGSIIEWQRNTVKPDMQSIVDTLNEYLVPEFGDNLVLGFCDPVPEDRSDDIDEATKLFAGSIITRNEARELVDMESVVGGDVFIVPMGQTEEPDNGFESDDEAVDQEIEDEDEDD